MRHANPAACQDQIGRQSARPDMGTVLRNPALPPLARQPAVLEIEEIKSVPYTPVSHPFVERLIGTIRREYLDRMFLERGGLDAEAGRVQKLLQRPSRSSCAHRLHASAGRQSAVPRYCCA